MTELVVYKGTDSPCEIRILKKGSPVDFAGATRMLLTFRESDVVADSNVDGTLIDWSVGNGFILFRLGGIDLDAGNYTASLTVFDGAHPNGQPISHPDVDGELRFRFVGSVKNALLVVQDDDGLVENANGYVSLDYFKTYCTTRGHRIIQDDEQLQIGIILATDYIEQRWGQYFLGNPLTETQALHFPRDAFVGIPEILKKATAEYAIRALAKPLAPDPVEDPTGYQVSREMKTLGPLQKRKDFAFLGPGAQRKVLKTYAAADMWIAPLLKVTSTKVMRN